MIVDISPVLTSISFLPDGESGSKQVRVDEAIIVSPTEVVTGGKRELTLEPSVKSFSGPSASRMDRSNHVMITDALADVREK
jgi:hypothetical protein